MTFKSPLINVIHSGINKFSRKILRDFGEIESLQLSHDRLDKFSNKSFDYIKNTLENYFLQCRPDWKIHIYNENDNEVNFETDRFYWLIEIINGVQNFKRGIPFFSVNIAVCKNDETFASSIYDPVRDEFYFTEKGKGAYLNGKRIRVSNRMNIDETLFSINLDIRNAFFKKLSDNKKINNKNFRLMSCDSLGISWLSSGKVDCLFSDSMTTSTLQSGKLLLREAGGFFSEFSFEGKKNVIMANPHTHKQIIKVLRDIT